MKRTLVSLFLLACGLAFFYAAPSAPGGLRAESLWRDSALFSSRGEIRSGDILKIQFAYRNIVRYRNEMKAGETEEATLGKPGIEAFSFLPALEKNSTYKRNNSLEYNNEREFSTRIAVAVESVNTNGIVSFSGGHRVILNGQSERVVISGQVRSADIGEGNSVLSTDIANLSFAWYGPEVLRQEALGTNDFVTATNGAAGPGAAELTPETRQRLLLQYLNRVHDILFRE